MRQLVTIALNVEDGHAPEKVSGAVVYEIGMVLGRPGTPEPLRGVEIASELPTFNELGAEMMARLEELLGTGEPGTVKRELALSKTALEDALTRFNSACYRMAGTWKRADPELGKDSQ